MSVGSHRTATNSKVEKMDSRILQGDVMDQATGRSTTSELRPLILYPLDQREFEGSLIIQRTLASLFTGVRLECKNVHCFTLRVTGSGALCSQNQQVSTNVW